MIDWKSAVKRLTDNYAKNSESNIGKIFRIICDELEEIRQVFETIKLWRDIDNAEGVTLDKIGGNLDQQRGELDDARYRILLKTKIKRDTGPGDIDTVIEIVAAVLNIPHEEVILEERYPAGMFVQVPLRGEILCSPEIIGGFIEKTAAGGVGIGMRFDGAFQFSSGSDPEVDEDAGFSDINQSTGGFFGGLYKTAG